MNSLNRKLLRDLWQLRGQVIAIALVVACGIACFVLAKSAYNSLQLTQATYYDQYRFADVFVSLKRAPETLKAQIAQIPGVGQVQTRIVVDVTLDVPELKEVPTGRLISIPEKNSPLLNNIYIRQGRYIEPGKGDEVLISEAFAQANQLNLGDTIGAIINGRWEKLQIVGIALSPEYVYEVRGGGEIYPDNKRFGIIWMGREALAHAFDLDGAFNNVTLSLTPGVNETEVIDRLDKLIERYGGLGAYPREDQVSHYILDDEISSLEVMGTLLPSIFLAIAAFLLHIVLSRLVGTQRIQIAVLKAFGYTNLAIGIHYLKFVLAIVSTGGFLGSVIGMWLGKLLTEFYKDFFRFPLLRYEAGASLIATAILVSCTAAIIGGLSAVRRAISLPPAQAMRPEPPAQFRPTLVERLGWESFFSPASRIILRNLERKPLQAFLSILGIAVAAAILMVGLYTKDAITYLVNVQFYHVQREDLTLVFNEPRPARTRYEIDRLPGVIRAEPFRIVPARLRFEHRTYRSALTGIEPSGELRGLIDRHLYAVNLPADGVVLSTKLAEILGVTPGDSLTVEVLEGSRPLRQVAVVGLVDELMGVSAYMDIYALNRLMREGHTISGAYLSVDPLFSDRLYSRIKQIPAITGTSTREATMNSFEEISGKSMLVFTMVLVGFACIITFSVVYNAARIALSERSRELASLRIIGFTRAEIAFILLGEQGILTLLAIPLGFLLGYGLSFVVSLSYDNELFRLPLIITKSTYAFTFVVVLIAAILSGLIIRYQLDRLDLIATLKTRE